MTKAAARRSRSLLAWWGLVAAAIFVGANAHMLYVAIDSDPGCVAHLKETGSAPGRYRAAKSSC
ncbi:MULTISPECIES: hypothetical protein [Sinorhizobium]|uniref:Transmembrane protein n=1 Tax=Sinorhizobium kummerowiae TaxID=158892 RepID=A0ABY8TD02_9HYPH|nr:MULTISPECIES: hypothetical protein [Sinorhizobium]TWB25500.1 hypothetical protein FB001_14220 [Ensifer sp. SEMIA 135]AEG06956.1 hypothetical protein SinmeB_5732 [Sinorhizobium meliloti BL225C]AIM02324.1 hypothetical protein DU99_24270 [Sinorhizobium meliloti]ASP53951.1 hypothetical protein CDO31_20730 [Sinorhizobium meliloti]ASP60583.1 hypothetical protein CDO30_20070 [Sinorhizobium meliloti]